ncbi:cytoplasmic protein NCK2 [Hydra vulgaris]|uniref:Cytoplasmic protein NCK2 n=1 Tax=Hydra vulgaris TaxID=6087 RepID=T2MI47_HYDVU|nr:cytoplasmic protein NCK2 [Hydra vulgaris]
MEQESVAIAKYDYTAAGDGELTIRKNEKLVVIDDSQPWWKVQNEKSVSGYVPSNYLARKDSNKGKKNIIDNLKSKVLKNKRTSIDPFDSVTDVQNIKSKSGAKVLMVAFSKFKYTPQRDDELELNRGDQVLVIEMEHDGWCRGECNGKVGWFPFNYIQKVESSDGSTSEYADPSDVMDKPIISKVRTLYPFKSQSKEELSFDKDIILEIIDKPKDDPDWWRARKSNGEIGLVPRNYVEEIVSPVLTPGPTKPKHSISSLNTNPPIVKDETPDCIFRDKDWYHGTLSRSECEFLLNEHAKDGEYLIRNSESKPGDFSLSMKAPNRIKHFKILYGNNQYVIGQRSFSNIDELLSHYKNYPIYTTENGQKMHLLYPLNKSFTRNGVR